MGHIIYIYILYTYMILMDFPLPYWISKYSAMCPPSPPKPGVSPCPAHARPNSQGLAAKEP